jgi:hypothetical protein
MKPSPIVPTVDFDADGVQHGYLRLPWSRNESAWGNLMIPITVVRNGEGPTALLTGGNHGDEYEGPIALVDLAATLRPGRGDRPGDRGAVHELPGLPGGGARVADRRRQPEPHLSRAAGRHGEREDRRLLPARAAADGRCRTRLSFRRPHADFPAVRGGPCASPTRRRRRAVLRPAMPSPPRTR